MQATKKFVALVSLAAAPLIGGGVAAVVVTAAPAVAAPVHSATLTGHTTALPNASSPQPGTSGSGPEAPDPGAQQAHEPDNPGGHQDAAGANVNHQFDGVE